MNPSTFSKVTASINQHPRSYHLQMCTMEILISESCLQAIFGDSNYQVIILLLISSQWGHFRGPLHFGNCSSPVNIQSRGLVDFSPRFEPSYIFTILLMILQLIKTNCKWKIGLWICLKVNFRSFLHGRRKLWTIFLKRKQTSKMLHIITCALLLKLMHAVSNSMVF